MGKFKNFLNSVRNVRKTKNFSRVELVTQNNSNFFCGATEHMIPTLSELALMHRLSDSRSYPLST